MTSKRPVRQVSTDLLRAVLIGAGLGLSVSVFGVVWRGRGEGVPVDWHELLNQGTFGSVGGAIIAFVLHLTRAYRTRGTIQHYLSWILASVIAAFVLISPDIRNDGWRWVALESGFFGIVAGLGLGLTARQVSQDGW